VANADIAATAGFQTNRDLAIDQGTLVATLARAAERQPSVIAASSLSEKLLGDSISANLLLLGYAWQLGSIPLPLSSIEQAIALNGKAVPANLRAFAVGRQAALEIPPQVELPQSLESFVARRIGDLTRYWKPAYANRYADLMKTVCVAAAAVAGGDMFAWAVARSAYKLMAYKDEYEVARLYADGRFREALAREFQDVRKLKVHLAPPLLARTDPRTGRPRKIVLGGWIFPIFTLLASVRRLREGPLDLFGRTAERRVERDLRDAYLAVVTDLAGTISEVSISAAVEIAAAPLDVRGFGQVKAASAQSLLARLNALRAV
jgi:indolepyruvate ferredoxin oxidoreductase